MRAGMPKKDVAPVPDNLVVVKDELVTVETKAEEQAVASRDSAFHLDISGIDVDFPVEPYDVQVSFMRKAIEAMQGQKNALLESPTGTGKTLCLLCSTLAWQAKEILQKKTATSPKWQKTSNGQKIARIARTLMNPRPKSSQRCNLSKIKH